MRSRQLIKAFIGILIVVICFAIFPPTIGSLFLLAHFRLTPRWLGSGALAIYFVVGILLFGLSSAIFHTFRTRREIRQGEQAE